VLPDAPVQTAAKSSKEELMHYFSEMYTVRRMEIACDTEYKARNIRGFCHLYDGQEGVGMGMQAALAKEDHVATSYRCHGNQYFRGGSVKRIVAELFGFEQGDSKGKGGSMHLYSKARRFWGGAGIVGAQVPIAGGLAFMERYKTKGAEGVPMNVACGMFGDGAANQGQIWETANMAKLWKLPLILVCENNQYGMGTSTGRHSSNDSYYTQGGMVIPGVQCDGFDVLAVREATKFCKEFAGSGKGPIFLEMKTYRYHGHSMSDPGITYRDRDEVTTMRAQRDCIEQTKGRLIEAGFATDAELKDVEKAIRAAVNAEIEEARKGNLPPLTDVYSDIHAEGPPAFIRMPTFDASLRFPASA
jgi:pyruvate dehydrogenase E1 component alpha subunit